MIARIGLLALALTATACGPFFDALSAPPVGRTARLDDMSETIEVSAGVALAFDCRDNTGEPCGAARATTDDPAVARVLPAYLDETSEGRGWHGPQPRAGFVVYGVAPGKTLLRIRSESGDEEFRVSVIE